MCKKEKVLCQCTFYMAAVDRISVFGLNVSLKLTSLDSDVLTSFVYKVYKIGSASVCVDSRARRAATEHLHSSWF